MTGAAMGRTENLVKNPNAEQGLTDWVGSANGFGLPIWTATGPASEGNLSFYAGAESIGVGATGTLAQFIDLSKFAEPLATGALTYEFSAQVRVGGSQEEYGARLEFTGSGVAIVPQGAQNTWTLVELVGAAPSSAGVDLRLDCINNTLPWGLCDAYFDEVSFTLAYE